MRADRVALAGNAKVDNLQDDDPEANEDIEEVMSADFNRI